MPEVINMIGKKYGKLLVIKQSNIRGNGGQIKWDCICDCGNNHTVTGESLRHKKSKSCGCYERIPRNKLKNRELAIIKVQYSHLRRRHKRKSGEEEVITLETFQSLVKDKCFYCGLKGSSKLEDRQNESKKCKKSSDTIIKINGIDRINNNIGYSKENSVSCCKFCNFAKHTMSQKEFLNWIKRVYKYSFIKKPETTQKEFKQGELF